MTTYAWDSVFAGLNVVWDAEGVNILIGLTMTLTDPYVPANLSDEQIVSIDGEEYDFSVDINLRRTLWDWAFIKANNAVAEIGAAERLLIQNALAGYEIE